jgi:hypothetical protein
VQNKWEELKPWFFKNVHETSSECKIEREQVMTDNPYNVIKPDQGVPILWKMPPASSCSTWRSPPELMGRAEAIFPDPAGPEITAEYDRRST